MKYMIEIEEMPFNRRSHLNGAQVLYKAKGFNSLVFDREGLGKLSPIPEDYIESRETAAYKRGLSEGLQKAGRENMPVGEGQMSREKLTGKIEELIQKNKFIKAEIGGMNSAVSVLQGICREDREDAYRRGWEEGYDEGLGCGLAESVRAVSDREYQRGLRAAWEAARTLSGMPWDVLDEVMNGNHNDNFYELEPEEAVERLKAFQQAKSITEGDE